MTQGRINLAKTVGTIERISYEQCGGNYHGKNSWDWHSKF